jgi:FkbH-like protein
VDALLDRLSTATLYVAAVGPARAPASHVLDPADAARGQGVVDRFMAGVRALGERSPRIVVVDWDWHVRLIGMENLTDARLWYLARMRLGPVGSAELADLVALHLAAARGRVRKVLAVDYDDTLWGGVLGEAGLTGIELGEDGVGLAFQDFQRQLLRLRATGVVLVGCSKNDEELTREVFAKHPAMVLGLDDLAAVRVNWEDKASNLRALADELDVGIDSFVFIDDNPVERDWVRSALPEVLVPELPSDPVERPAFIADLGCFARVGVTEADRGRAASYRAQAHRKQAAGGATSLDDFLRALDQTVLVEPVSDGSLARAAQLCQRTNQFNLTNRRHTIADIEAMTRDDHYDVCTLSVADRYGDSGITGVAIVAVRGDVAEIDTLLLSCRVLGRRIEEAFLTTMLRRAAARGARKVVGVFVPSDRNGQVADFYARRGFAEGDDGVATYDLEGAALELPADMTVRELSNA